MILSYYHYYYYIIYSQDTVNFALDQSTECAGCFHCSCGAWILQIVCRSCSRNRYPLKYMKDRMAKVCDHCYNELKKRGGEKLLFVWSKMLLSLKSGKPNPARNRKLFIYHFDSQSPCERLNVSVAILLITKRGSMVTHYMVTTSLILINGISSKYRCIEFNTINSSNTGRSTFGKVEITVESMHLVKW